MEHSTHSDHGQACDPHAGHKMSDIHGSHERHAGHSVAMFRDRFWLSFALTIPVVFWSTDVQRWLGYTAPSFPGSKFIPAILGTVVFVYGGLVFIRGAWGELADRKPGMMTLISLAIIVAFGTSVAATFGLFETDVWWELASLITIMVLGHWLEMHAISQARGALNALAALLPDTAERVKGSDTEPVTLSELGVGDIVLVRPGARVPAEPMITVLPEVEKLTTAWASDGKTVLYAVAQGRLLGAFAVEDEIRPESSEAVTDLHRLGIRVAMITGDSKTVADSVARRIGIDEVAAEVLPADKASAVRRFQAGGKKVAMVGDGVNDAPALATATVGIAIGAGTDVAIESAGIVLVRSDPRDVVGAIELSRATYRKMIQNLVCAIAYNLIAIPVAAGLFVHWGFDLPMSIGAVAMSLSTIIVAANAQFLRGLKLQHDTLPR